MTPADAFSMSYLFSGSQSDSKEEKTQKLNVLVGGYVCLKTWNGGTRTVFPPSTVKIFLLQTWLLEVASSVLKWISFPEENMQEIRRWTRVLPPQLLIFLLLHHPSRMPPSTDNTSQNWHSSSVILLNFFNEIFWWDWFRKDRRLDQKPHLCIFQGI